MIKLQSAVLLFWNKKNCHFFGIEKYFFIKEKNDNLKLKVRKLKNFGAKRFKILKFPS